MRFSFLGWNATIIISDNTYIENMCVYMHNGSTLKIGIHSELVGCHFSLWDSATINYKGRQDKIDVKIGNHVWIGMKSVVMYNTNIGNGSIVGACSFVKCEVPNNVLVFGSPAKMKRKDVAWSRAYPAESISDCGEANINKTECAVWGCE